MIVPKIQWSDLIIEKGKLDPLAIWRVGDRLIADIFSPFTTILNHRAARYFSMYAWFLYYLDKQGIETIKEFWKRFFEFEAVFICAILFHKEHMYENFAGMIGSESAANLVKMSSSDYILIENKKLNNGWENNYKNPMYEFNLIESDLGISSGIKLTDRGVHLAEAYECSISNSMFFKKYLNKIEVPKKVIEDLAIYSCPCLRHEPNSDYLKNERDVLIKWLIVNKDREQGCADYERFENVMSSIELILRYLKILKSENIPFTYQQWRKTLSTHFVSEKVSYTPPQNLAEIFNKWDIYTLESLFVFSLESALSGFLDYLHKNDNIAENKLNEVFRKVSKELIQNFKLFDIKDNYSIEYIWKNIFLYKTSGILKTENELVSRIDNSNSMEKIVSSFWLCLYVQSQYLSRKNDPKYADALSFYITKSNYDGLELSLEKSLSEISKMRIEDCFKYFMHTWIINRQVDTRYRRNKDVAWFIYNQETNRYNWEESYRAYIYRAARSEILMTFLLNLGIVRHEKNGWVLNEDVNPYT